jgi:hypothetical protein
VVGICCDLRGGCEREKCFVYVKGLVFVWVGCPRSGHHAPYLECPFGLIQRGETSEATHEVKDQDGEEIGYLHSISAKIFETRSVPAVRRSDSEDFCPLRSCSGRAADFFKAGGLWLCRCRCAMHCALTPTIGRVHRGPDKPAVVANAIGHSDDRACVSANDGPMGRSGEWSRELALNP